MIIIISQKYGKNSGPYKPMQIVCHSWSQLSSLWYIGGFYMKIVYFLILILKFCKFIYLLMILFTDTFIEIEFLSSHVNHCRLYVPWDDCKLKTKLTDKFWPFIKGCQF